MKTLTNIFSTLIILSLAIFGQEKSNYFPHDIGDRWEWNLSASDTSILDEVTDIAVLSDESIDVYLNNSEIPRYNVKSNSNVYQYFNYTKEIWYDFDVAPGDTFYTTIYSAPYYVTVDSIEGELFGEITQIRVFEWYSESNHQRMGEQRVSNKFGMYYRWSNYYPPSSSSVIGCKIDGMEYGTLVNVSNNKSLVSENQLFQNYPNPFNPTTTINFFVSKSQIVELSVYNLLGEKITTLVNRYMSQGNHSINFDGSNLPSGVYIYKIMFDGKSFTKKMELIK